MKAKVLLLLLIACSFCAVSSVQAAMVNFYNDANITSGDVYGQVGVYDNAKIQMFGGIINQLSTYDSSVFALNAGQIIVGIVLKDSSIVNIYGGTVQLVGGLALLDSAILNIYGGSIYLNCPYVSSGTINIFGYGFSDWPANTLTGFLSDGTAFRFTGLQYESSRIHLWTTPEPATVLILGLGLIILLRKSKK